MTIPKYIHTWVIDGPHDAESTWSVRAELLLLFVVEKAMSVVKALPFSWSM